MIHATVLARKRDVLQERDHSVAAFKCKHLLNVIVLLLHQTIIATS